MNELLQTRQRGRSDARAWALSTLLLTGAAQAALITAGTPTTGVPGSLHDPLATLTDPLPAGRFLLPIEVSGASGLQDWTFDLRFDNAVVTRLDVGGLYQSVYQAEFNATDATLSDITGSGLAVAGALLGIAGLSWGLSGDGTLAYLLFEYRMGQEGQDPGFDIDPPGPQTVPAPSPLSLMSAALMALAATRRSRTSAPQSTLAAESTLLRGTR